MVGVPRVNQPVRIRMSGLKGREGGSSDLQAAQDAAHGVGLRHQRGGEQRRVLRFVRRRRKEHQHRRQVQHLHVRAPVYPVHCQQPCNSSCRIDDRLLTAGLRIKEEKKPQGFEDVHQHRKAGLASRKRHHTCRPPGSTAERRKSRQRRR